MTRTLRWFNKLNLSYNPYWSMHEIKEVRIMIHRKYRHMNRFAVKNFLDIEIESKTNGWITY